MKMRVLGAVALLLLVPACNALPASWALNSASLDVVPVRVTTRAGKNITFKTEVARTEEEQNRGLMYRDLLPRDKAMLFPLDPPRFASFWMKNCPAPIDMIFIRADGTIARIQTGVPYSVEPVESGETVAAVLEIRGGHAAELGIGEDDQVAWDGKLN